MLRLPIYLYHAGLSSLLDHRFMLLTHRGRKSGRVYETVLEVILYHPQTQTSFVASGWGIRRIGSAISMRARLIGCR